MYDPYLPQYGFGDWLRSNAGTIGTVAGGAIGILGGPAGVAAGASIGGALGGAVQQNYEQDEAADVQAQQIQQMQAQQAYQNRLSAATQGFNNQGLQQRQFAGTQNFAFGGPLNGKNQHGINYNQLFPQKTPEGQDYYITRATTETMNNPNFYPFAEGFSAFTDPKLAYEFGNTRGVGLTDDKKVVFNADSTGDSAKFRKAVSGKLSYEDLGIIQPQLDQKACGGHLNKRANGGLLNDYTGQLHSGPQNGIPVDAQGNPTVVSQEQPVGLVEGGESSFTDPDSGEVYIFSDQLSRK